jgi:type II secretory pathway pseudopilin PulG
VELIVVVAILAVLVVVAIPVFGAVQRNARDASVEAALKSFGMQMTVEQELAQRPINIAKASYNLKVPLGPRDNYRVPTNYGLLCANDAGEFAIYMITRDGNTFLYSSAAGKVTRPASAPGTASIACPAAGVKNTTTDASGNTVAAPGYTPIWTHQNNASWMVH